ncbi:hypothetical protein DUNSADRAFT_14887 [Dunaliella salina]|uniref:CTLH/CRA C-terminal to LisH motif domain-containing protein n=1 Tax=Dunaliella salina TaxID=3046 RepID=A0ABQ7G6J6_DUNSA|nr:hypothetical protein DUNSADRAFT_14887 [Dunaliella salina]|eukprot:KAF5830225.1 hypothetical protein DUNSADRAFT_14887 [Dunaliella salina]
MQQAFGQAFFSVRDSVATLRVACICVNVECHMNAINLSDGQAEFIELVRRKEKVQAIHYAREHLAPWASQYLQEFQRAVATLALPFGAACAVFEGE